MTQQYRSDRGGAPATPAARPPDPRLREALVADNGDALEAVAIDQATGSVGRDLAKNAQVRKIFGEIRRIESRLGAQYADEEALKRALVMLGFRARYAAGRERDLAGLAELVTDAVRIIEGKADRFARFVNLMEAVVAERTWRGGKSNG
mgnify:CR=1 FL=1